MRKEITIRPASPKEMYQSKLQIIQFAIENDFRYVETGDQITIFVPEFMRANEKRY